MNPIMAQLILELEQKGFALAVEAIQVFGQDVLAGKPVVQALNDIAMSLAEKQAAELDKVVG